MGHRDLGHHDWAIVRLGTPGFVSKVEIDTNHFKGNYPDRCSIQAAYVSGGTDSSLITQSMFWPVLLIGAALLQLAPINTGSTLIDEFCERFVYFVAGYLFAARIFALADAVRARAGLALLGLAVWAVIEAVLVFTPTWLTRHPTLASLPVMSLMLGAAGAPAIVSAAALLTKVGGPVTAVLRACGERSIVIYLAFFLPMAALRTALVKSGVIENIGLVSLLVTVAAVAVPLVIERAVYRTPAYFLFRRPAALHLVGEDAPRPAPRLASAPTA